MSNCAIVGINWGDEGKGRMVDYLSQRFDVVVRYQGGGNAGHTVINDMGKFALHLLPSGVFHKGVMNILGNGVALDCENLLSEIETLRAAGVPVTAMRFQAIIHDFVMLNALDGTNACRAAMDASTEWINRKNMEWYQDHAGQSADDCSIA